MDPIQEKVKLDAPRDVVYDFLSDLANRPAFTGPYQDPFRLERIESRGVGAAARFQASRGLGWISTEIEHLQPPHRIVERGRGGRLNRIPNTTVWELVETPGGVTEVTVTFFTRPETLIDRLNEGRTRAAGKHRRGWRQSLRNLRQVFETEQAAPERANVAGGNRYATGIA